MSTLALAAALAGGGSFVVSCDPAEVTPVDKPTDKPTEVVNTPTVSFTITENADGTVNLTNSTTDATSYEWYVGGKLIGSSKDLQNVVIDSENNPYSGFKRKDSGSMLVNGSYPIVLKAINKGTTTEKTAEKTQTFERTNGTTLLDNTKFGIDVWDKAGVSFDGFTYLNTETKQVDTLVNVWNMGPEYETIRSKKWKEIDAMGYHHIADFLRMLTEEAFKDPVYAGFSQDFPETFKALEEYINVRNYGIGYDLSSMGVAFNDNKEFFLSASSFNVPYKFQDYVNLNIAKFFETNEISNPTPTKIALRDEIVKCGGVDINYLKQVVTAVGGLDVNIRGNGKVKTIKSTVGRDFVKGFITENIDPRNPQ